MSWPPATASRAMGGCRTSRPWESGKSTLETFPKGIGPRRAAATAKEGSWRNQKRGEEAREAQGADSNLRRLGGKRKIIPNTALQLASARGKRCPWS